MTDPAEAFTEHALSGRLDDARGLLASDPGLTRRSPFAAACYGDAAALAGLDDAGTMNGGPRGWPLLLYLCYSDFQRFDPDRRSGILDTARLLLATGADPNARFLQDGDSEHPQTALYGACGRANNPALARLLLESGADPNEGVPSLGPDALYHAAELPDLECLRLILAAKPDRDKVSYCLGRKLDFEDMPGARLFLDQGADPDFVTPYGDRMTRLHHAVQRGRSKAIVALLLERGADTAARTARGRTAYALAVRYGRTDVAALLAQHGPDALNPADRFIGACAVGDLAAAGVLRAEIAAAGPGADDLQVFATLAGENNARAVDAMLRMGFDPDAPCGMGTALHHAAWSGAADAVDALLAHRPDLERRNDYGGTALDTALFGATHCHDPHGGMTAAGRPQDVRHGDYPRVVRALLAAGADPAGTNELPTGVGEIDALFAL